MRLDLLAFDGEQSVAQTAIDLQLLDDPAEFRDPRPDHDRLAQLARSSGGQILKSPEALADLVSRGARAGDRLLVSRQPLWDRSWVWLLLLTLLATEWIVRRLRGLT
jgi:hypothetical protein